MSTESGILQNDTGGSDDGSLSTPATLTCIWNETIGNWTQFQEGCQPPGGADDFTWIRILVLILYAIVCIVGLCGNTLVIYVVVRFSKMQTVTNLYIVNLAIADECFLVGIPFLMVTLGNGSWLFGDIMCKIYFTTTSINQVTSSMFLLIMSADRYLAVCHPISATKYRTPVIASAVALTAWTLSAIMMAPIFMYTSTISLVKDEVSCNIFWPSGWMNGDQTFIMYSFFLGFLIPLVLISIFYVLVILRLRHVGPKRPAALKNGNGQLNSNQQNRARDRKKSHRKVTKLVLTVIAVYFICWAPYWGSQLVLAFMISHEQKHSHFMLATFLLTCCLSYSNSAMNPILYAFLSDNFKKSFLKACSCSNRRDINAALHVENSVFPRGSKKGRNRKRKRSALSGTSSCLNNQPSPQQVVTEMRDEEEFLESEDEGAAILGRAGTDVNTNGTALTSRVDISNVAKLPEETTVQNGIHVTSL